MENMTFKEKADHIWTYYRLHIIGTILLVLFVGSIISGIVNKKDYVLDISLLGSSVNNEKIDAFQQDITRTIIGNDKKKTALVEFMYFDKDKQDEMMMATMQKLAAMVATGSIDVMILDKDAFDTFCSQDMFLKLDEVPGFNSLNTKDMKLLTSKNSDGAEGKYAIDISDNQSLKDLGYDTKNKVLTIVASSKNQANAVKFIKWFLKA
jgi:hypothetical protein